MMLIVLTNPPTMTWGTRLDKKDFLSEDSYYNSIPYHLIFSLLTLDMGPSDSHTCLKVDITTDSSAKIPNIQLE